jgi:uncharacterized protein YjbI with pentapeptide repeats
MLNKFFSVSIRTILLWTLLIGIICLILWFVFDTYSEWQNLSLTLNVKSDQLKAKQENLKTMAQLLGGIVVLIGLGFTGWNSRIAQKNMEIAEDGKITDRFSKAVEQLGNDKLEIRLGGIYALERIAIDSEKDRPQIMEIFTAFVRNNSSQRKNEIHESTSLLMPSVGNWHSLTPQNKLDTDIQAVLTVIGRRKSVGVNKKEWPLDLNRTYLSKAYLEKAYLVGTHFQDTLLEGAFFREANLERVDFYRANLKNAILSRANLKGSWLWKADLEKAILEKVNLKGATLREACLKGATLWEANLEQANLCSANLEGANFYRANLKGAHLSEANFQEASIQGANLQEATLWEAVNLTIEQLSTVETLYNIIGLDDTLLKQVQENYPYLLKKP